MSQPTHYGRPLLEVDVVVWVAWVSGISGSTVSVPEDLKRSVGILSAILVLGDGSGDCCADTAHP